MLHLKNITAGNPKTAEQYQMTKRHSIVWLFSEDGKNWYEEQKNCKRQRNTVLTLIYW